MGHFDILIKLIKQVKYKIVDFKSKMFISFKFHFIMVYLHKKELYLLKKKQLNLVKIILLIIMVLKIHNLLVVISRLRFKVQIKLIKLKLQEDDK